MNQIAEEILSYYGYGSDEDFLEHYGMPRRSGRYPWGSGDDPYQHGEDFISRIEELKKQGWTETPENIKKEFGLTTTQYRTEYSLAKNERRMLDVARAKSLKEDGLGATEIGRKMGISESTVRSLLDTKSEARMNKARETADALKKLVDEKGMLDVGTGVERELNISREKLNQALKLLDEEGYPVCKGGIPQATNPGQQTNQRVLCPPGTPYRVKEDGSKVTSAIYDYDKVNTVKEYISRDDGATIEKKFNYPSSMDSKRLMICYKEDGGVDKDGLVELRRGVPDLSLGESRYSQVRILVDGNRYIKGMAVYADDLPPGVDVRFNTNKSKSVPKMEVLKEIKPDPDNPFGSSIKDVEQGGQYWFDSKTGERIPGSSNNPNKKLGLINKTREEGDWSEWKDSLPSQFLSKQSLYMAHKQLGLAIADKKAEYDEICSSVNPTVKKHLLTKFADECDSAAVHLQAAALPGQKYHVIVPINTLKDNEVYAPGYDPGTKLALVRYPHGGTFEIPVVTVNNKNPLANKVIGKESIDAIGINSKVAARLSGADFDGDTVMCIPTDDRKGKVKILRKNELEGLKGFEPKEQYGADEVKVDSNGDKHYYSNGNEFRIMKNTGVQMGVISNLITDMTLKGATDSELAAAVRHSMVVIDAEKHKLDYKRSELDNNISALKKKYQSYVDEDGKIHTGGASTLISRAKGQEQVIKRQGTPKINIKGKEWYDPNKPEGSLIYKTADDAYYDVVKTNKKTGETTVIRKERHQQSTKMAETDDARTLISDYRTDMEIEYADYANKMKAMANNARKEYMTTKKIEYSKTAKDVYKDEVRSLNEKLDTAILNKPREREANRRANVEVSNKINQVKKDLLIKNPNLSNKELNKLVKKEIDIKKVSDQAIKKYRDEVGAVTRKKRSIKITDREWEAIQAGAISESKLKQILDNTDIDSIRQRAIPRTTSNLSQAQVNRAKAMSASNYTIGEIAKKLGVSTSTVSNYLKGES